MLEPKWVIAMGAGANSGGMYDDISLCRASINLLPVDVYVRGLPAESWSGTPRHRCCCRNSYR
ncbi:hypothetical protein ACNKHN_13440 [Shigella flexneri]